MTPRSLKIAVFLFPLLCPLFIWAGQAESLYRDAYMAETVDRDLEKAVALYGQTADVAVGRPALMAKCWLRQGLCHERMGHAQDAAEAFGHAISFGSLAEPETVELAQIHLRSLQELKTSEEKSRALEEEKARTKAALSYNPNLSAHRVCLISAGLGAFPNLNPKSYTLQLDYIGYEYIRPTGWSYGLRPFDSHREAGNEQGYSSHFSPLWVRRYSSRKIPGRWFFGGLGFDFYTYTPTATTAEGASTRASIAFEVGIDTGKTLFKRHTYSIKYYHGASSTKDDLYLLLYGFSLGFQSRGY